MNFELSITYRVNGRTKTKTASNEDFDLEINNTDSNYSVVILPKSDISVLDFYITTNYNFSDDSKFFANGFQSWTDTKEFSKLEKMKDLGLVGKTLIGKSLGLENVGDYTFVKQAKNVGEFHSHGFAYVRNGEDYNLIGSLSDRTGYTIIYADMNQNTIKIAKDLEGVVISKPYKIMDLYFANGSYDEVFDKYFSAMGVKPITNQKIKGYTSWYNYYQDINEKVILRDLESMATQKDCVNTFQIDDGYQTAVGAWLSLDNKKFPNGLKCIVDKIHESGFKAGLWLAPFGAQWGSKIAKEHNDWLIKNEKGKPITVGPNWGGFYALNIYNPEVRAYIKKVFNEVLNVWGFDLVKLDFLYAASVVPNNNKTRGEIAYDAMDFLRECVGDKAIIGCGVQMLPSFGKVDYMRIGSDMNLSWKGTLLQRITHREDVSTIDAIHNSIYRRCLNGRAFLCDTDVFLLRSTNIKFTFEQQKLLAKMIKLLGSVLFMSDNIAEYNDSQLKAFQDTLTDDAKVQSIEEKDDVITITYVQNEKEHIMKFCVLDGTIYQNN